MRILQRTSVLCDRVRLPNIEIVDVITALLEREKRSVDLGALRNTRIRIQISECLDIINIFLRSINSQRYILIFLIVLFENIRYLIITVDHFIVGASSNFSNKVLLILIDVVLEHSLNEFVFNDLFDLILALVFEYPIVRDLSVKLRVVLRNFHL